MRIALGLGKENPEWIGKYINAGVDEFFAGYVSPAWREQYNWRISPTRRSGPLSHYKDIDSLRVVAEEIQRLDSELLLTFNFHYYTEDQLPLVRAMLAETEEINPDGYVVATPALIKLFQQWGIDKPVHLSTGAACFNSAAVRYFSEFNNIHRVVVPRKMTLAEIESLIDTTSDLDIEYEAMIYYRCLFNDEYCFSWHIGPNFCEYFEQARCSTFPRYSSDWKGLYENINIDIEGILDSDSLANEFHRNYTDRQKFSFSLYSPPSDDSKKECFSVHAARCRYIDCGLCAIGPLKKAGLDVLKLGGRTLQPKLKQFLVKLARTVAEHPDPTPELCRSLVNSPDFCQQAGTCFYRHQYGKENKK